METVKLTKGSAQVTRQSMTLSPKRNQLWQQVLKLSQSYILHSSINVYVVILSVIFINCYVEIDNSITIRTIRTT